MGGWQARSRGASCIGSIPLDQRLSYTLVVPCLVLKCVAPHQVLISLQSCGPASCSSSSSFATPTFENGKNPTPFLRPSLSQLKHRPVFTVLLGMDGRGPGRGTGEGREQQEGGIRSVWRLRGGSGGNEGDAEMEDAGAEGQADRKTEAGEADTVQLPAESEREKAREGGGSGDGEEEESSWLGSSGTDEAQVNSAICLRAHYAMSAVLG